jgi:hypothetical protein
MSKEIETQVLVVGAGPSGITAAIGAAREGIQVLLVEEDPVVGGGFVDFYTSSYLGGPVTGIFSEMAEMLKKGYSIGGRPDFFLPHAFSKVQLDLLEREPNLSLLTGAKAVGVHREIRCGRPILTGITVESGPGAVLEIQCDIIIDASGNGKPSILGGCESMYGRESKKEFHEPHAPPERDSRVQHCTWMYFSQQLPGAKPFNMMKLDHVKLGVHVPGLGWFHKNPDKAMELNPGIYLHWGCAIECQDTRNPLEIAKTQQNALKVMDHDLSLLRENGYTFYLAPRIGIRETSRIVGEHVITENDLRSGVLPEDTIALGNYGLDIWGEDEGLPVDELRTPLYGIPYRALVPRDVNGLLLAGKIISGTHVALSAYRVTPILGSVGQAAGVSAALCLKQKKQPRELDPGDIQEALRSERQKVVLSPNEL